MRRGQFSVPVCPTWAAMVRSMAIHLVAVVVLFSCHPSSLFAETNWAERLGYPPGQRVIILYAGHMGLCHETNAAGQAALRSGAVGSAGLLVPCPWFNDCAEWLRENPNFDVGVSLAFNSGTGSSAPSNYRWGPVSSRADVPSLVDAGGKLPRTIQQFTTNATSDDVAKEIEAQIRRTQRAGIRPTHLTPHLGALFSRPDLMAIYLEAAKKFWLPAVVIELTPDRIDWFRHQGFPLDERTIELIANYPLPKLDDLRLSPDAESFDEKRKLFAQLLQELPPGLTMIVFRPASDSSALRKITDRWQQHVWDAQLLSDQTLRGLLKEQDIVLTSWREIMQRFEGAIGVKEPITEKEADQHRLDNSDTSNSETSNDERSPAETD